MVVKQIESGFLISIEGIDGCGKSSIACELKNAFADLGYLVLLTKEPGGTKLGLHLRQILQNRDFELSSLAEYLLFAADRAQHMQEVIKPALSQNYIVISDRMADSSIAYQGFGRGLDCDMIKKINEWILNNYSPDLVIYLQLNYVQAFERVKNRNSKLTSFEKEKKDFFANVIRGFETVFKDRDNVLFIDASRKFDEVKEDVINKTFQFLFSRRKKL